MIRFINVIAYDKDGYLASELTASRHEIDAGETKLFYETAALNYNDDDLADILDKVLFNCDVLLEEAGLSPLRTSWVCTAALFEDHFKKNLRKPFNDAMNRFKQSGQGDGGPEDCYKTHSALSLRSRCLLVNTLLSAPKAAVADFIRLSTSASELRE